MIQDESLERRNETALATSSGTAQPFEGVLRGEPLLTPFVKGLRERCPDDSWSNRVDAHVRAQLVGQLGGEVDQGSFAHGIPAQGSGGPKPGDRRDVDDRPTRRLRGAQTSANGRLDSAESTEKIDF